MGLIIDKMVNNHSRLGVWKIEEEYDELTSKIRLNAEDQETLNGFKNYKRKLEWLSVRVLLNTLTQKNNVIVYNGNRKPFIADRSCHISISHSFHYSTVLISSKSNVGIDIERMQPKITHIAEKFINDREMPYIQSNKQIYHLYLHWCAKEALYKMFDKRNIRFKNNIIIEPFHPKDEGRILGKVHTEDIKETIELNYFHINNYSIVWGYKD